MKEWQRIANSQNQNKYSMISTSIFLLDGSHQVPKIGFIFIFIFRKHQLNKDDRFCFHTFCYNSLHADMTHIIWAKLNYCIYGKWDKLAKISVASSKLSIFQIGFAFPWRFGCHFSASILVIVWTILSHPKPPVLVWPSVLFFLKKFEILLKRIHSPETSALAKHL